MLSLVLAVKDIAKAREFYESTLGLQVAKDNGDQLIFTSGNATVEVYVSDYAGTNQATAATWEVADIESIVNELKSKGVTFEQYDMEGVTRDGNIHTIGDGRAAWFKDPDGNILCLHTA